MKTKEKDEHLKEAFLWYKRKVAISEDINIGDIKETDIENVEILTEKNKWLTLSHNHLILTSLM